MTESDLNYPQAWFKPPPPLRHCCKSIVMFGIKDLGTLQVSQLLIDLSKFVAANAQ